MPIKCSAFLVLLSVLITIIRDCADAGNLEPSIHGDDVALLHGEFRLQCDKLDLSPHRDEVSYLWYRNSTLMSDHSGQVLLVPNVTKADQGNYTCAVRDIESGILSPRSNPVTMRAYPSLIPRPHIRSVGIPAINSSFILVCDMADSYSSSDNVAFAWYKEGTQTLKQFTPGLHFSRVREEDGGVYTCAVEDRGDSSPPSEAFHLTPLGRPEVHIGLKVPDNVIKGILGENVTLTCEVTQAFPGVSADGYSWSYLPSLQGPRRPLVGKASTLTLGPLTREDGGQYFCEAKNNQNLPGRSFTGKAAITVHVIYLQNITLTSNFEVKKDDSVTLICKVVSFPAARLAWTVHGQEVRHVTDNLDHYVIPRADCSDSTSYTCRASNTDLPGREISASTRVRVQSCSTAAEVSATLDFRLPNETTLEVVHPRGQVMVTVQPDCSLNISSAFLPRLLHPRCDPVQRVLTFTLTKVTGEDEGNYTCREDGPRGKLFPSCGKTLRVPGADSSQGDSQIRKTLARAGLGILILLVVILVVILLVIWCYGRPARCLNGARRYLVSRRWREDFETDYPIEGVHVFPLFPAQPLPKEDDQADLHFEANYSRGEVHVIPPLPEQRLLEDDQADLHILGRRKAKDYVLRLLRELLEEHTHAGDPPVFVFTQDLPPHLHAVIYHSSWGVTLVRTEAVSPSDSLSSTLVKAARHLSKAGESVEAELGDLLEPEAVSLLLALPNLKNREELGDSLREELDELDVQPLCGRKIDVDTLWQFPFIWERRWMWRSEPDRYQAFVTAVKRRLPA